MPKVSGLILMGGQNKRMNGQHKAFLKLNDKSFLEVIMHELSALEQIYLSVNDRNRFNDLPYPLIEDIYKDIGPLGGIYAGLKQTNADYLFVTGCDMPFITDAYVRYMTSQITPERDCIFVADEKGRFQPLGAIYSKSLLPIIEEMILSKNYRLRPIIEKSNSYIIPIEELPFDSKVLSNINTPEDFASSTNTTL